MIYYLSDDGGKTIRKTRDHIKWAYWFESCQTRQIALDVVGTLEVSTVFLGLDHAFDFSGKPHPPVLWETMIFATESDSDLDQNQWRYSSYEAALAGHREVVEQLRKSDTQWRDVLTHLQLIGKPELDT